MPIQASDFYHSLKGLQWNLAGWFEATMSLRKGSALIAHIIIMDVFATMATLFGFAQVTLIIVADVIAPATGCFPFASISHVVVFDVVATTTTLLGPAIGTLVIIFDVFAVGIGVPTEHQQNQKNGSHHWHP